MSSAQAEALRTFAQVLQSGGIILGFMLATILTYLVGDVLRRLGSEEGALIPQEGRAAVSQSRISGLRPTGGGC